MKGRPALARRRLRASLLALYIVLLAAAGYYAGVVNPVFDHIPKGLDLAGGVRVVLQAQDKPDSPVTPESMQTALEVIRRRVDALGVAEPVLQIQGRDRIAVELPGADPERALEVIGRTALLEFRGPDDELIVTGANLVKAQAAFDPLTNDPVVLLEFDSQGTRAISEATARLIGLPMSMYLDGELIMDPPPRVSQQITTGEAVITGLESIEEAQNVAVLLSSGALPVELEVVENRSVSALLGEQAIARSQQAALYGIGGVIVFMLLVYRLPGIAANLALALYGLIVLATLAGINATLTLPGIAGIILSVGMAVDANVIVFERIREELRAGTTVRAAIDAGFRNALSAILDANITTLIAAAALAWRGTGPVRGFAVTLSIGVVASMITAVFITRFLLRALVDTGLMRNPARMFGVAEVTRA